MLQVHQPKFEYTHRSRINNSVNILQPSNNTNMASAVVISPAIKSLVSRLQSWRNSAIELHLYKSALYWADKIVSMTGTWTPDSRVTPWQTRVSLTLSPRVANTTDIFALARICFEMGDAVRAEHLLKSFNVVSAHVECRELAVQCLVRKALQTSSSSSTAAARLGHASEVDDHLHI